MTDRSPRPETVRRDPGRAGASSRARPGGRRVVVCAVAVVMAAIAGSFAGPLAGPAGAAPAITAEGIELDISATCEKGNVNITYEGTGISRQVVDFTSQDGTVLDLFDVPAYASSYDGLEYVLTKAGSTRGGNQPVPATGTSLGVYVMLGDVPPVAANAEFFLLYRCDATRNDRGGDNVVLQTCVGPYGTCPKTAEEALAPPTPPTSPSTEPPTGPTTTEPPPGPTATEPRPPVPRAVRPTFTG